MFLKAVDTGGETKDAAYIAGQLIDCTREVGADSVIQVVIDSAIVCKAIGRLVEQDFSWITWTPCTPHCLDLLLEDVGKLPWATEVVVEAKAVVKFITNHHRSYALFRGKSALDLLKPGDTCFATNFTHAGPYAEGERGVARARCQPRVEGVEREVQSFG